MFIIKNVNCKEILKVFSERKATDYIEHLIAEYGLQNKKQKVYAKVFVSPISCLTPISKEFFFFFFSSYGKFQKVDPPLIRGEDFHYEHILLFMEI